MIDNKIAYVTLDHCARHRTRSDVDAASSEIQKACDYAVFSTHRPANDRLFSNLARA